MPRGNKKGHVISDAQKLAISQSLRGNIPWNKGKSKPKVKMLLSKEDRNEATRKAVLKAAETRKQRTAQRYIDTAPAEWQSITIDRTHSDYITALHVPCGSMLKVQAQTIRKWNWSSGLCKKCNPVFRGTSKAEEEVAEFCSTLGLVQRRAQIDGFEYDIVLHDLKIAIEYNGLYWHSEKAGYPQNRHLEKTEALEKKGWKVIHIFEDEWLHQREIVVNRLSHIAGKHTFTIGARKCHVKWVNSKVTKSFIDAHHIQKSIGAKYHLALFHNSTMVMVATFGKARFRKDHDWELLRLCSASGVHIPGGASKLIKEFTSKIPGKIISYADRRWSSGNVYTKIGFILVGKSPPSYSYFKGDLRANRLTFQKSRISHLPTYSIDKTEAQIMAEDGWNRIYDCGTLIFSLDSTKCNTSRNTLC